MKNCKYCGQPMLAGAAVHGHCFEAAMDAAELTKAERQELDTYRAIGVPADELPGLLLLASVLRNWDEAQHLIRLVKADEEGRLVELLAVPELKQGAGEPVYILDDGEIYEDWVTEAVVGRNEANEVVTRYYTYDGHCFESKDMGSTVFMSAEEAEKAKRGAAQ